jgi:hypothetical protein
MEKYGFIYLWYDRKHRRYYLGRHWGTEDDGYICSSNTMREAHRRRPQDFVRRIVSRIHSNQNDLISEEQRWLDMIKKEELNNRYYNKTQKANMPSMIGHRHSVDTIEKMRLAHKGKIISEAQKEKLRILFKGKKHSRETKDKMSRSQAGRQHSSLSKEKIGKGNTGKIHTLKQNVAHSATMKDRIWINNGIKCKLSHPESIPTGFKKGRIYKRKKDNE